MTLVYDSVPGLGVPGAFVPGLPYIPSSPQSFPPGGYVTITPAGPAAASVTIGAAGPLAASVAITLP